MRKGTGDECPCADARFEITLCQELRIGSEDRNSGNRKFRSQNASGGNLLPGRQVAMHDGRTESLVDLTMQRSRGFAIYKDKRRKNGRSFAHRATIVVISKLGQVVIESNHFLRETLKIRIAGLGKGSFDI